MSFQVIKRKRFKKHFDPKTLNFNKDLSFILSPRGTGRGCKNAISSKGNYGLWKAEQL